MNKSSSERVLLYVLDSISTYFKIIELGISDYAYNSYLTLKKFVLLLLESSHGKKDENPNNDLRGGRVSPTHSSCW
jgi:hypothetical protein